MGLDLTLVPIRHHEGMDWWLGHERLGLDRDGLGHMILNRNEDGQKLAAPLKPKRLPRKVHFDWYGDEGIERTTTDSYGDPLFYVKAGDLAKAAGHWKGSPWNEAAMAFVKALPADTPIILWWH